MEKLQSILVGVDFEPAAAQLTAGSLAAAKQAIWLAEKTGARIEFLHSSFRSPEDDPAVHSEAALTQALEAFCKQHAGSVDVSALSICNRRAWVALAQRALTSHADLVVVAKRNHLKRDDRKLGSVSMKLVRQCPSPVWVVKPEHELRHRCVVAATDLSEVGDLATEYGAFVAGADDCELCVVHAWQVPMELQLSAARIGDEETEQKKQAIAKAASQHILNLPSVKDLGSKGGVFLVCDTPSHAIQQLVEQKDPDLVVMGTVSRGGLSGMLVGNTAEKLLYQLDCSLLTVKPADFISPLKEDELESHDLPICQ